MVNQRKDQRDRHRRRGIYGTLMLAAVLVASLALYELYRYLSSADLSRAVAPIDTLSRRSLGGFGGVPHAPVSATELTLPQSLDELLAVSPDDQPLAGDPADLAPFPGATRLAGTKRPDAAMTEMFSHWQVRDVGIDQLIEHYTSAAAKAGFTPNAPNRIAEPARSRHLRFTHKSPNQTLVIRLHQRSAATHIIIWLRIVATSAKEP